MDESLADFVVESGKRTSFPPLKEAIRTVGRELISNPRSGRLGAKKFLYDHKVQATLERMSEIPFEDFVGQFNYILMPFDAFWIESTPILKNQGIPDTPQRVGFFLKIEGNVIAAHCAAECLLTEEQSREPIVQQKMHIQDGKYIYVDKRKIVFGNDGIKFVGEEGVFSSALKFKKLSSSQVDQAVLSSRIETSTEVEKSFQAVQAMALYRLLVLLSSRNIKTNFVSRTETHDSLDTSYGSITPIRIDLSDKLEQALRIGKTENIRQLLGWTDVERHTRTYHTRSGPIVKVIEPYERRIAAPVDRRGVARHITSSNPNLGVEFGPDRPKLTTSKKKKNQEPPANE